VKRGNVVAKLPRFTSDETATTVVAA